MFLSHEEQSCSSQKYTGSQSMCLRPNRNLTCLMGLKVSSPTMLPIPELRLRTVEATKTPPGLKTRLISATCNVFLSHPRTFKTQSRAEAAMDTRRDLPNFWRESLMQYFIYLSVYVMAEESAQVPSSRADFIRLVAQLRHERANKSHTSVFLFSLANQLQSRTARDGLGQQ